MTAPASPLSVALAAWIEACGTPCCPFCNWAISSHGDSGGFGRFSDCPWGAVSAAAPRRHALAVLHQVATRPELVEIKEERERAYLAHLAQRQQEERLRAEQTDAVAIVARLRVEIADSLLTMDQVREILGMPPEGSGG